MSSDNVELLTYTTNIPAGVSVFTPKVILSQYISLSIIGSASEDLSIVIQFSGDGSNWDYSVTKSLLAGSNSVLTSPVQGKWMRLRITNVSIANTTHLRIFCYASPSNSAIQATLVGLNNLDPAVQVSNIPLSAFGEVMATEDVSKIEYVFVNATSGTLSPKGYNIPYEDIKSYSSDPALEVTFSNGVMSMGSGFTVNDKAWISGSPLRYRAGVGVETRFTGRFYQDSIGEFDSATQLLGIGNINSSLNTPNDGYFFGNVYQSGEFCIVYYNNGSRYDYPQSTWNVDVCDGTNIMPLMDFSKFNIFEITYQYLGFGYVRFYVVNPNTGYFQLVHQISRLNSENGTTNLSNPSLGLLMYVEYESELLRTPVSYIGIGSMGIRLQGNSASPNERLAIEYTKSVAVVNETVLLNIRCSPTFYSKDNYWPIDLDFLSASVEGTKNVVYRLYRNATLTGDVWTFQSQYLSPLQYDVTGTKTALTGTSLLSFTLGKVDTTIINLGEYHIHLNPSDTLTITVQSTGANYDAFINLSTHIH